MKFHQAEALILEVSDLQEADRIVVFLTREEGKRRGVARGAKRRFSRFAGELQPLAKARIGWMEKDGRDLVRIGSVELLRPVKHLQLDLEGILLGATIAEQAALFAQEGEPSEVAYRLLDATVEALEAGRDRDLVARYFESWLLRTAGIFPPPDACPECGREIDGGAALSASGEGLTLRFDVEDSGPGLSPEARANLFTPFFSTKDGGQGVGLTFVQEVLSNHGCDFALDANAEGVTTFTIAFR